MQPSLVVRPATRRSSVHAAGVPHVGPWRLEKWIGQGHWTRVYQTRPGADCPHADYAIKLLKPEYRHDPVAIGLLQREACVGREVAHTHLICVLAANTDRSPFYLVTPFLQGATLRASIRVADRLNVPHALWLVRQAAEAIEALHARGWLHGDVKPDNIFVAPNGHVTLFDLGLARRVDSARREGDGLGATPAYAPPEQFRPQVVYSPAFDVYSLGVTLYESLTGRLPFSQSDPDQLAAAALTQPLPDPRRLAPEISSRVIRLLRHMLAKDPLRRPHTSELVNWLVDLEIEHFDERRQALA